ncbi:uncharacterized protein LOC129761357 [Toxorhynchites rutilus septentrionalis]|uniref:uncharacterized protein LOC129761357 n=1 Tax=Toxorhynchites rutilus septentrionalis TaxID=329112 RepID=UPI00247A0A04|nr:uncharacterized protein LOC129761357 [Toxorhynchites rutilus septentrionalis]
MIIVCKDGQQISKLEKKLQQRFEISSLGEVSQFLGIKVTKNKRGMYSLSQRSFIKEVAERFGLDGAKTSKYPLNPGYFRQQEGDALADNVQYHSLVGALLYIAMNSRPDIAAAISILSRRTNQSAQRDWVELKRVVRYLVATEDHQLSLSSDRTKDLVLIGYSDADWAGDSTNRKSTSGFLFQIGEASVS